MKRKVSCVCTIGEAYSLFEMDRFMIHGRHNYYKDEVDYFLSVIDFSYSTELSMVDQKCFVQFIDECSKHMKPVSINHYIKSVGVFFHYCMDNGYMKVFKIHTIKAQSDRIKFYSEEELKKLLVKPVHGSYADERAYTIISFIMSTGCRASTLINIKMEDIDFIHGEVYYEHLKNKDRVIIPLNSYILKLLQDFRNTWDIDSEYMFCEVNNNQMTVGAVRQSLNRYCKRKGVKPRSIHAFRHSFAREYIKNGGDVFTLQKYMTHSDISVTKNYVNLFGSDLRNASEEYIPLKHLLTDKKRIKRF